MTAVIVTKEELEMQERFCDMLRGLFSQENSSSSRALTYRIRTYGCQLNESDSEKMAGIFEKMGLAEDESDKPGVLLLNTCAIRENAEDRLFGNLGFWKTLKTDNPDMLIVLCGCMTKLNEDLMRIKRSFSYVDIVFGPQDIHRLPEYLYRRLSTGEKIIRVSDDDYMPDDYDLPASRKRKFRALVPIMYGCDNFCTYCVVPYTRGRERSRDFGKIIEQLRELSTSGFREVMLLGQNVNSYGRNVAGSPDFPDLLERISGLNLFSRVRFMTSQPKDLSNRLIDIIAENPCIERHLHLPFQSGSNDILRRMNRGYTRERYLETALRFRESVPEGTISTDIIVGFPGETENDFTDTLNLMNEVRFDSAFTFIYSRRPGTVAADMSDAVPEEIVAERFSRLLELQNSHCLESNRSVIGSTQEVLIEGTSHTNDTVFTGRTSSNRLVNFTIPDGTMIDSEPIRLDSDTGNRIEGRFASIRLLKAKTFSIEGRLENFTDGR